MDNTLAASPVAGQKEPPTAPDYAAIKQRQQAVWASGDFATIGVTLQIVGECLAEAASIGAGERVLDVAAGNGNATLAAAHRFAQVTSTDFVPALLDKGRQRAAAEGLVVDFQVADAEHLQASVAGNAAQRAALAQALLARGLKVSPSQTNFLLVEFGDDAGRIESRLVSRGVVLRPMGGYGLGECLRITVGKPAENARLLAALDEVLA